MDPARLSRGALLVALSGAAAWGCHRAPLPVVADAAARCDSAPVRAGLGPTTGPLTPAQRDTLLQDVRARRAAWRARGITDYRVRLAVGCFCPWRSTPAILEVRGGVAVALRDTTGRPFGAVREPWSLYTVEGFFDAIERAVQRADVVGATYDACLGYPRELRGDGKVDRVDDWFWATASDLRPQRLTR